MIFNTTWFYMIQRQKHALALMHYFRMKFYNKQSPFILINYCNMNPIYRWKTVNSIKAKTVALGLGIVYCDSSQQNQVQPRK